MLPNMYAAFHTAQLEQRLVAQRAEAYWRQMEGVIIPRDPFLVRVRATLARVARPLVGLRAANPTETAARRRPAGSAGC